MTSPFLSDARYVLNELTAFRIALTLRAIPYSCWRCGRLNHVPWLVHVDGWRPDATRHQNDPDMLTAEHSLPYVAQFLKEVVGGENQLTRSIKPRYSRSARGAYLSHGCVACDALLGQCPLSDHWLNEHIMTWQSAGGSLSNDQALDKLPILGVTTRPYLEWLALGTYYQQQVGDLINEQHPDDT